MALITEQSAANNVLNNQFAVQLRAVNTNGKGQAAEISVTPSANPTAPTKLMATAGNEQVTLNWTAPSYLDVTDYEYVQGTDGNWQDVPSSNADTISYTVTTSVPNGTEFMFRVRA